MVRAFVPAFSTRYTATTNTATTYSFLLMARSSNSTTKATDTQHQQSRAHYWASCGFLAGSINDDDEHHCHLCDDIRIRY